MQRIPKDAKIRKNIPRLTHYIEESNTGKGFIKEQSFSPCGTGFLASDYCPLHSPHITGSSLQDV